MNNAVSKKCESLVRCLKRIENKRPDTYDELIKDIDLQDIISVNLERAVHLII